MRRLGCLLLFVIMLISGCSCDNTEEYKKTSIFSSYIKGYLSKESTNYVNVEPFGTYISIVGYKEKEVAALDGKLNSMINKYHSLLDRNYYYKDENGEFINNITVINDSFGTGTPVVVDDIIIEILKEGIKYTKLSNGSFNIVSGSIVDVWDARFILFSNIYGIDPTEQEVLEGMKCVPSASIIDSVLVIDEENNTVTFNGFSGCNGKASITLGALAKSFFLDKLVNDESFKNIGPAIYDAGQSSIIVRGENPVRETGTWNIAIRNSLDGGYVGQLQLKENISVSTSSGDNKGYINESGVRRHHILDATTGYPNTYLLAATVLGDSAMVVDIVTTTLLSMSNIEDIENYLINLKNSGVNLRVLLQIEENDELKALVNDEMKNVFVVSDGVLLEVFNYGA